MFMKMCFKRRAIHVQYCCIGVHGISLNCEITVNSKINVFLFLLRKLKLVIFLPIFILLKHNVNIPSSVVHNVPTGGKQENTN